MGTTFKLSTFHFPLSKVESGKFESGKFESVSGSSARTSEIDIGSERGELYSFYMKQGFVAQFSNFLLP